MSASRAAQEEFGCSDIGRRLVRGFRTLPSAWTKNRTLGRSITPLARPLRW